MRTYDLRAFAQAIVDKWVAESTDTDDLVEAIATGMAEIRAQDDRHFQDECNRALRSGWRTLRGPR